MTDERTLKVLTEINERLGQLVSLTADGAVADLSQRGAVEKLGSLGFDAKSIAAITGYPVTSVAPALSRYKRGRSAGR